MKKIISTCIWILFVSVLVIFPFRVLAQEGTTAFTATELATFDGKNGHPAYFAYEGKVYDVTGNKYWTEGDHYGNLAGQDLTGKMGSAPHGEEVLKGLKVVGTYAVKVATPVASNIPQATIQPAVGTPAQTKQWFESPIRIAGLSILGWSGILLGVFFVLNFATCFVMPWSKLPLPWKGSRPGPDPLDTAPTHMYWTQLHKYFAWLTVVMGIVHGVLGLMQLLGYRL
jgi:predicted heme/steroid binding protein